MPGFHMMLRDLVANIESDGRDHVFSTFTLDFNARDRQSLYFQAIDAEATLHFALDSLIAATPSDIDMIEDVLSVAVVLSATPFGSKAFGIPPQDGEPYFDT